MANRAHSVDRQNNDATDLATTQRIRRSVISDREISTYGHNVKIVSEAGVVTLNGVVRSETERRAIAAKAVAVVGTHNVVNHLTVAADN